MANLFDLNYKDRACYVVRLLKKRVSQQMSQSLSVSEFPHKYMYP